MIKKVYVSFFDMDSQETVFELEMSIIPRIGETVWIDDTPSLVRDVYWYFDSKNKKLENVVISIETIIQGVASTTPGKDT